jgi:hypothetical protein
MERPVLGDHTLVLMLEPAAAPETGLNPTEEKKHDLGYGL